MALGVALACMAITPGHATAQQKHGDVNGDGAVTALDAQAILSFTVGLTLPPGFVIANGNANCDVKADGTDNVGALDAQIVLSYVIGLNVSQYCVGQAFGSASVAVDISPKDSSLLINRGMVMKATVKDNNGFLIKRPIAWSSSNPAIVSIDSVKGDSLAFVKASANPGSSTITATSDGASFFTQLKVFLSYAGIVITPQRADTIRQLLSTSPLTFFSRTRDSLGTLVGGSPNVLWSIADTAIAGFSTNPSLTSANVVGKAVGTTFLRAVNQSNPADSTSIRLVVKLPPVNTCLAGTGSVHNGVTYTSDQHWTADANPHFVNGGVQFSNNADLTIDPGVLVCMNSFASITFNSGSRLMARGTVASPITITRSSPSVVWSTLQFGTVSGYTGTTTDTSVITNALIEYSASTAALDGRERHTLVVDSVKFRQSSSGMVRVLGPGSRVSRSTIDTVGVSSQAPAVYVGRGTVEETTIRNGVNGTGIQLSEAGAVRATNIIGGVQGLTMACCTGGATVNDVTISGTTGIAVDLQNTNLALSSSNVQISGGSGGSFRGTIGNLGILWPDSLSQATLKNNGRGDSLFIQGGTLTGKTLVVRPDQPWLVTSTATIDTLAQLIVRPGARIGFQNAYFSFASGGTLDARGELGKPIRFFPSGGVFYGLLFNNPGAGGVPANAPTAISQLSFATLDSAQGIGSPTGAQFCCSAAINSGDRHRLLLDSVVVRKTLQGAFFLSASGSELKRSVVDTTGVPANNFAASYVAVGLGDGTLMQNSLVRRAGNTGVQVTGNGVRLDNVRVVASTGVGLQAESGSLTANSTVRVDSANAYAYRGTLQNLFTLASDSTRQANSFIPTSGPGNVDSRLEISTSTLAGSTTPIVMTAIPQLPWLVFGSVTIDTLTTFAPRPAATIGFYNAGMVFNRGGVLQAIGEAGKTIRFRPWQGSVSFNGITFNNPGAGPNPALAPTAESQITFARVDSATGSMGQPPGGFCCQAALNAGDRHRLLVDSVTIHKAEQGAVWAAAPNSVINRVLVDTTGLVGSAFTATYPAVAIGGNVTLQNSLIRRSGANGLLSNSNGRIQNVRVVASVGVALQAESGQLQGDVGGLRADSANSYGYRGTIQNLATLAPDSASQKNTFVPASGPGNADSRLEISGSTLVGTSGSPVTLTAIPQLPWLVFGNVTIDTLAHLAPRPASTITFYNAGMVFQRGGYIDALGEAGKQITFRPYQANVFFNGMTFQNPGPGPNPALAPVAQSQFTYVRVDSATGSMGQPANGFCCQAAINAGDHHRVLIDSMFVHKSEQGAVWAGAPGSVLNHVIVDTTGLVSNGFTATYPAIAVTTGVTLQNALIRRSGAVGLFSNGGARLQNVRVVGSVQEGLQAETGQLLGDLGGVRVDSANAYQYRGTIQNLAIIAGDSTTQAQSFLPSSGPGNVANRIEIAGSTLVGAPGSPVSVMAIPQIPWLVFGNVTVDTLATLLVRPSATLGFWNAGMVFQRGGTLQAVGDVGRRIIMRPWQGGVAFNGLTFQNPGPGPNPALAPTAISQITYARLDSATGSMGQPTNGFCCQAAINAGDHHQLAVDSVIVHKSEQGAVWLGAPGSTLSRALIDTTGPIANGYVATYPAVALGDNVTMSNSLVRRSGITGVLANGNGTRLQNIRVVGSLGIGVQAEGGILAGDLGTVRADSANAYAFRGKLQNLAILAPDSTTQANSFLPVSGPGNANSRLEITTGTLTGTAASPVTVTTIPQLPFLFVGNVSVDTFAVYAPRPSANVFFQSAGLQFQHGGTLNATGTATKFINFKPWSSTSTFNGLSFHSPGAGTNPQTVTSTMSFVRVDSATGSVSNPGPFCCQAAINGGDRHILTLDSVIVHKAEQGAIWMQAPGSQMSRSVVDTTGPNTNGFVATYPAVGLQENTTVNGLVVRRGGATGIYVDGNNISMTGVRVVNNRGSGIQIANNSAGPGGSQGLVLSGFTVDSNQATGVGVSVESSNVTLQNCDVVRNSSHGIALNSSYTGVVVTNCNIGNLTGTATTADENIGSGIFNPTTNPNFVNAVNNWWGRQLSGAPITPASGTQNGITGNVTVTPTLNAPRVP